MIKGLRNNDDIVILRPDKGRGVVLMDRKEYIEKMLDILNDLNKCKRLGNCAELDDTAGIERSMQTMLLKMHKAGEIPEAI